MGAQIWQLLAVRLVQAFLVVLVVTSLVFLLSRTTGDPLRSLTRPGARIEVIERQRESLGLNDPLIVQYGRYLGAAVQGDFGTSFRSAQPPMDDVRRRIWPTAQLGLAAFGFSLAVGISVGVLSAVRRGSAIDLLARILALIGQATPSFWMGLMLIFLFAVELGLLPTGGRGGAKNLILPAVTLGSFGAAATLRLTRSSMLEVLDSDFIRTARAKGLRESAVIRRHALRNALFPRRHRPRPADGQPALRNDHHRDRLRLARLGTADDRLDPHRRLPRRLGRRRRDHRLAGPGQRRRGCVLRLPGPTRAD